MNKFTKLLAIVPFLVLISLLVFSFYSKPDKFDLLQNGNGVSFWPWADEESKILSTSFGEDGLECSYYLDESSPYAGVTLTPQSDEFWDLSQYEYIEISVDTSKSSSAQVSLSYFLDGFSSNDNWQSLQLKVLPLYSKSTATYRVSIRDIQTPMWWYRENNVRPEDIPATDYSKLANINILNGTNITAGNENSIAFTSLKLVSKKAISTQLVSALLVVYIGVLLILLVSKYGKSVLPNLKNADIASHTDEEYEKLSSYLIDNYTTPNLTAGVVAEETGISSSKITQLIQTFRKQSYSQFLNTIRLDEAKKLLRETDRNVSDISAHVGYSYVNSFNRVFKNVEGKAPLEYRTINKRRQQHTI